MRLCIKNRWATTLTDLHAKGNHGDEHLEDERQCQLPHGCKNLVAGGSVRQRVAVALDVSCVSVVAQLGGVKQSTVIKQLWDELAGAHARVAVGESEHSCERRHNQHL